jgi:hypothetical protein
MWHPLAAASTRTTVAMVKVPNLVGKSVYVAEWTGQTTSDFNFAEGRWSERNLLWRCYRLHHGTESGSRYVRPDQKHHYARQVVSLVTRRAF